MTAALTPLWWMRLQGARWFGGRGRDGQLVEMTPLPWITAAAHGVPTQWPAVRPEIARVVYADGGEECYQIVASYRPLDDDTVASLGIVTLPDVGQVRVSFVDEDQAAMQAVARAFLQRTTSTDGVRTISFHLSDDAGDLLSQAPTIGAGDWSNTLIGFSGAVCKILRRFDWGIQLAVQTADALRDCWAVPRSWGYAEVRGPEGVAHLLLLTQRVDSPTDGWQLATRLATLREIDATWAADIGRALADVHRALAGDETATVPVGLTGARVAEEMLAHLDRACAEVPELGRHRASVEAVIEQLRGLLIPAQRIHGDFHLAQTLVNHEHWWIVDFDGEPLATLAERARPDSPLRDVAGLLRSLDYARASAPEPNDPEAVRWANDARVAFLTAYADRRGSALSPDEWTVLRAYTAHRCVYEATYEARHRPTWLAIPLRALDELNEEKHD